MKQKMKDEFKGKDTSKDEDERDGIEGLIENTRKGEEEWSRTKKREKDTYEKEGEDDVDED